MNLTPRWVALGLAAGLGFPILAQTGTAPAAKPQAPSEAAKKAVDSKKAEKATGAKTKAEPKKEDKKETKKEEKPADKAETKSETKEAAKDSTGDAAMIKVERDHLKIEVKVDGSFESGKMTEIILRPERWTEFTVVEAAEHGAKVKKGDPLVTLDMKKIDEEIASVEAANQMSLLALKQAEEEYKHFESILPFDLKLAQRASDFAEEELSMYLAQDKQMSIKQSEFTVKMANASLENAQEELKQLEKMYKADDLREETEEIVLKRAKDSVEQSKFFVEMSKVRAEQFHKYYLARTQESVTDAAAKAKINLEKTKATLPFVQGQKKLTYERAKYDQGKADEKLAKLKLDRKAMHVTAPDDGVVYYGKCTRGSWGAGSFGSPTDRYLKGQTLRGEEVWMTIVRPKPLFVRVQVPEKEVGLLKTGLVGKASPTANPDKRIPVRLDAIADIPLSGNFDCRLSVTAAEDAEAAVAGMTCSVKFVPFQKDALAVPIASVFTDEKDDEKQFVYVKGSDGKPERRDVGVGRKAGEKWEIVRGLKEGEMIYKEKPAGAKS
ncbi:MAG TPA: hypothetical protein VNC50_04245 [Planctomycetia bacterium]|nr:hypothetical protein [Planctomycetia bacterium]